MWKISPDGGEALPVTRQGGYVALESPDGKHLYYTKTGIPENAEGIWEVPVEGGAETLWTCPQF